MLRGTRGISSLVLLIGPRVLGMARLAQSCASSDAMCGLGLPPGASRVVCLARRRFGNRDYLNDGIINGFETISSGFET